MRLELIDRYYAQVIRWGLIGTLYFGALFQAAHNLWAACVFFGVITLLLLLFCAGRARDGKAIALPFLIPIFAVLLAFIATVPLSYDWEATFQEWWGWVFSFICFYLFINVTETVEQRDRFLTVAGLVIIPIALHCAAQRFLPHTLNSDSNVGVFGYGRFEVPFSQVLLGHPFAIRFGHWEIHANLINSVVMAGFTLYWTLLFWRKTVERRLYVGVLLACGFTLILSASWWAFISLGVGAMVYSRKRWLGYVVAHKKVGIALMLTPVIGVGGLIYIKTHQRIERPEDAAYYHANSRLYYWSTALRMARSSPLTGIGLGAFGTAYPHFKTGPYENTRFAHGWPFQLLSESGVLGTLACLAFLLAYLRKRLFSTISVITPMTAVLDGTLVAVATFSLISINMDFLLNKYTFLLLMGATLVPIDLPRYRIRPLWLLTGGMVCMLISALWLNLLTVSRLYVAGRLAEGQGNLARAEKLYKDALALEQFHADSAWRLSQLLENTDPIAAKRYRLRAYRYKKDIHFTL